MDPNHYDQEFIEMEPFDREYGLQELLPLDALKSLFHDAAALLPPNGVIFTNDGSVYFQQAAWQDGQLDIVGAAICKEQPETDHCLDTRNGWKAMIFPIQHELETKGYLALPYHKQDRALLTAQGQSLLAFLFNLMHLKHQTMLTSGLHGMVVEESYGQLKKKAEQLAQSEEKYRLLAANLEIEVERKTAEIRKTHAHIMQQEKLAAIGQLSAGMAHEINNPLGFIISNLDTLKEYAADLDTLLTAYRSLFELSTETAAGHTVAMQCRSIQELEKQLDGEFLLGDLPTLADESLSGARRIQKIISDLKIVARPGEIDPEPVDIHQSINAVLTILDNRIGQQLAVVKEYGQISSIHGYPQEINQIWLNLINNALDAMEDKGTLTITTLADQNQVSVSIHDTGCGIEKTCLPKIFDPFYTTKKVGSGMGLGLHLVYSFVHKHNGRIEVDSKVGTGSTVTVNLPFGKGN